MSPIYVSVLSRRRSLALPHIRKITIHGSTRNPGENTRETGMLSLALLLGAVTIPPLALANLISSPNVVGEVSLAGDDEFLALPPVVVTASAVLVLLPTTWTSAVPLYARLALVPLSVAAGPSSVIVFPSTKQSPFGPAVLVEPKIPGGGGIVERRPGQQLLRWLY